MKQLTKIVILMLPVIFFTWPGPLLSFNSNKPVKPISKTLQPADIVEAKRTLIARGDFNYPPFEYLDDNGEPQGFNVDIIKAVANVTGLQIRIILGPWENVRDQLEKSEIDLLIGMFKTEERMKKADFTIPHFISTYTIFTQKQSQIKSFKDLSGKKILVQSGDLGYDYVIEQNLDGRIIEKQDWAEMLKALNAGEGDAAIAAMLQGTMHIIKHNLNNVVPLTEPLIQRSYCIAVPKGEAALLATLNEGLNILKTTGEYDEIYEKWFGIYEERFSPARSLRIMIIVSVLLLLIIFAAYIWNWNLKKQVRIKTGELTKELEIKSRMQNQLEKAIESFDISRKEALKARYEAEEANEAKTRFLANISHELRTPLHGIIGISKLLETTPLNREQMDMMKMISTSAENLTGILSDLLDFSSIHSGKLTLRKSFFNLRSLIDTTAPVMKVMALEKNLKIIMETGESDPVINTDKERVGQILLNLFSNAVKYTDSGHVKVSIFHYDEKLEISVADTGVGIEPEYLDTIFEPFSRIENNTGTLNRGVGLGLSIVKSLVDLLNGEINVESRPGEGSRFIVFIPALSEKSETPDTEDAAEKTDLPEGTCSGINVLIVEDENINRLYLKKILSKKGCITDTALNGLEALNMIKTKEYNLILMDLTMPVMDGITATREIRIYEKSRQIQPVPVIALTAHAYPEDMERCREAGMDGYLSKPFQPSDLMKEIARVLDKVDKEGPF